MKTQCEKSFKRLNKNFKSSTIIPISISYRIITTKKKSFPNAYKYEVRGVHVWKIIWDDEYLSIFEKQLNRATGIVRNHATYLSFCWCCCVVIKNILMKNFNHKVWKTHTDTQKWVRESSTIFWWIESSLSDILHWMKWLRMRLHPLSTSLSRTWSCSPIQKYYDENFIDFYSTENVSITRRGLNGILIKTF